ncbi:sodium:solute symporter [Pseudoalteromonas sp.]|uniref:sodium:solute symporter n=1 Tax=Pseudoalteromonas sp. TaxID=53249 RepID=UPI003567555D
MRKFILFLLLVASSYSFAETKVDWQPLNGHPEALTINKNSGYFLNNSALFISTNQFQQLVKLDLATNNRSTVVELTPAQGNREAAVTLQHDNKTFVLGGLINAAPSTLVNVLQWNKRQQQLESTRLADLPRPLSKLSAQVFEQSLYIAGFDNQWYLYKIALNDEQSSWTALNGHLFNQLNTVNMQLAVQNDGERNQLFAVTEQPTYSTDHTKLLTHVFNQSANAWHTVIDRTPTELLDTSNLLSASPLGQSHILAVMQTGHVFSFNTITKAWSHYQQSAYRFHSIVTSKQQLFALATHPVTANITLVKGSISNTARDFGWQNMVVLVIYLLSVVLVGLYFMFKNKNTNDYFRGGQSIPWWAAACSIYATMLSSLTYIALPAIVYQTNWVLLIGIWMIIAVAPIAVYIAIPFFRQLDATSAYEFLSKRFNMPVRLFASGLFTLFHIGRMGIVMALTALALSAVTPISAAESVLIMGVLCLLYCTLGGVEAVIWTDTIQTVVLLIGAIVCFFVIIAGLDDGFNSFIEIGFADDKFTIVNTDFSLESITTLSIWVIVLGGIGQNLSSYTADQAVVQRYMVTKDPRAAAKSIWANAILAAPGALLFFCIGSGLYAFYQLNPQKLDPSIQIDQIFPTFIANELPIGVAGLIIAGIFAAAQSTVSTSMNSIATTVLTDFVRPFNIVTTEQSYMSLARALTFISGVLGTLVGLVFIDPEIRSLMEAYFKVIGMFMGALGGIFILGALTKRANSIGAMVGIISGVSLMISAWKYGWANGYLYGTIGILTCLVVGYLVSLLFPAHNKDLTRLTLFTMKQ